MHARKTKILAALLLIVILVIAAVGAVFGYLSAGSGQVSNTIAPATDPDPTVVATTTGVPNPEYGFSIDIGNLPYAVYVRVAVVINWQNNAGEVYAAAPVLDTDYTMDWNSTDWVRDANGFYYHKKMVASNSELTQLISAIAEKADSNAPEGYDLHVEFIVQTIQALGGTDDYDTPAVTKEWGVTVDANGELVP